VGSLDLAAALAQRLPIDTAIIALPDIKAEDLNLMTEQLGVRLTNMLVVPDLFTFEYLWAATRNIGGVLGIEL